MEEAQIKIKRDSEFLPPSLGRLRVHADRSTSLQSSLLLRCTFETCFLVHLINPPSNSLYVQTTSRPEFYGRGAKCHDTRIRRTIWSVRHHVMTTCTDYMRQCKIHGRVERATTVLRFQQQVVERACVGGEEEDALHQARAKRPVVQHKTARKKG